MSKVVNYNEFNINDYKKYDFLYLVFNRGFMWPFCKKHMMQLHKEKKEFDKRNIKVVSICPENIEKIERFLSSENIDLELVADPKHIIADEYNQQVKIFKLGRMPAQIILNNKGEKIFEHFANSMRDIIENREILSFIDEKSN